jgi:hypothetical protein
LKFKGYYLYLNIEHDSSGFESIDIINFNEKYMITYYCYDAFFIKVDVKIIYFDEHEYKDKVLYFKNNTNSIRYKFFVDEIYPISNKQFYLIKKNTPKSLDYKTIREYLIKYNLEELCI